jgi:alpha-methylacyl-CoA racemase
VADYGGGGMTLAFGIVTALVERATSGRGQVIDAAMVDGVSLLMTGVWSRVAQGRWPGEPGAKDLDSGAPFYDVYATRDGEYMAVGSVEPQFWQRLLAGLGLEGQLPEQWDRPTWPRMKRSIADAFATRSRAEWTAVFDRLDACVTPVLSVSEAALDPHLTERGTLVDVDVDGVTSSAPAPRLSRTPFALRKPDAAAAVLRRWRVPNPDVSGRAEGRP